MGSLNGKFSQYLTELSSHDKRMAGSYHFRFYFSKNISEFAIFQDRNFNITLANNFIIIVLKNWSLLIIGHVFLAC